MLTGTDSVHYIEQQTGWSIGSASASETGPVVTMLYQHQLQLKFYPGSFSIDSGNQGPKANAPVELTYHPKDGVNGPLSSIKLLILKSLQSYLATIDQSRVSPKQLLQFVSVAWDVASNAQEEVRMLGFHGVTNLRLMEVDDKPSLRARCTLLGSVAPLDPGTDSRTNTTSRIDVDFAVTTRILEITEESPLGILDIQTEVIASKVYGFGTDNGTGLSEKEMRSILSKELKGKRKGVQFGSGVWSSAVQMLSGRVF